MISLHFRHCVQYVAAYKQLILNPVQNYLAGIARCHYIKCFLIISIIEMMSNNRRDIQTGLDHYLHLVPGFKHFTAIDTLDCEAVEHNLIPVNCRIAVLYAQQGYLAPVAHDINHTAESAVISGHLKTHIKAFLHAQISHTFRNGVCTDIKYSCYSQLFGQLQPVGIDIGDDHIPGPGMPDYCSSHNAYRACPGD